MTTRSGSGPMETQHSDYLEAGIRLPVVYSYWLRCYTNVCKENTDRVPSCCPGGRELSMVTLNNVQVDLGVLDHFCLEIPLLDELPVSSVTKYCRLGYERENSSEK